MKTLNLPLIREAFLFKAASLESRPTKTHQTRPYQNAFR